MILVAVPQEPLRCSDTPWGLRLLGSLESSSALVSVSGWGIWSSGLSASGGKCLGAVGLAVRGLELVAGWEGELTLGFALHGGEINIINLSIGHTFGESGEGLFGRMVDLGESDGIGCREESCNNKRSLHFIIINY